MITSQRSTWKRRCNEIPVSRADGYRQPDIHRRCSQLSIWASRGLIICTMASITAGEKPRWARPSALSADSLDIMYSAYQFLRCPISWWHGPLFRCKPHQLHRPGADPRAACSGRIFVKELLATARLYAGPRRIAGLPPHALRAAGDAGNRPAHAADPFDH